MLRGYYGKKEILQELKAILEVLDMDPGEFIKSRNLNGYEDVYPCKVGYASGMIEYLIEKIKI